MNRFIALFLLFIISATPTFAQPAKDEKAKKRKPSITIGRDTTFIDGPLDRDGYPDYEAALNERLREGVTAENNANVLLFKAMGPRPERSDLPDAFFKWMKIKAPPENADYFIGPGNRDEVLQKCVNRPWTAKEHPQIANWLEDNEKPLAVVIEASKRSRYYYPLVTNRMDDKQSLLIGVLIPGVQKSRELVTALTARAMLRVSEKKYDNAWQDLLACHRLGRLVGQGGTLIEGLVGIALEHMATDANLAFLEHAKLDGKQLKKCLADLQKLPAMPLMADKVALSERFIFLQAACLMDRDGLELLDGFSGGKGAAKKGALAELSRIFNWDPALRSGNQYFNRMAVAMRLKDRTLRDKHLNDIELDIRTLKGSVTGAGNLAKALLASKNLPDGPGKIVGDVLICLLVPAVIRMQHAADRAEQTQHNLHVAFALAAYQRDNGNYPKALDALAPKYLASVPDDLFSGKALVYRPADNGYLLYSVGVNGMDDGGRGRDADPPDDDLPVHMPRRQ